MTKAHDICNALRSAPANKHDDMHDVLECLAAMVSQPMNKLSDRATKVVVDLIEEISSVVENDQIEQQQEAAWYERQTIPSIPSFERTYAQLDALTIRRPA